MKIYNSYVLTTALVLLVTTVILVATGQNSLAVYYSAYIIEAFIVTELYIHFNTKTRRGLNFIGIILFGIFLFIIGLEAIDSLL